MPIRGDILLVALGAFLATPRVCAAQAVHVEAQTNARLTQMRRIDGTLDAGRVFSQRVQVSGFDMTGDHANTLDVHVGFRFWNDFGLVERLKDDAVADMYWNQTYLEEAYVRWHPIPEFSLRAGRHTRLDALGVRDVDGLSILAEPKLGQGVRGRVEVWGGQDVAFEHSFLASDAWDIQGMPEGSQAADADWSLSGGVRAGLQMQDAGVEFAWMRRVYADADDTYLGEERLGVGFHGQLRDWANVVGKASYHTVLDDLDHASLLVAFKTTERGPRFSLGGERVVPVFDSGSIFNLFGAQPYEGAWIKGEQDLAALSTTFDLRLFGRIYEGDQDLVDFGGGAADATTYGAGFGHQTRGSVLDHPLTWRSVFTYSDSVDDAYGGARALAQTRVRARAVRDLYVAAGLLWLWAQPANTRYDAGQGVTGTLGVDVATSFGLFSGAIESSQTSFQGGNLQVFLSYSAEVWP